MTMTHVVDKTKPDALTFQVDTPLAVAFAFAAALLPLSASSARRIASGCSRREA